jgi:hypothetical protein
VADCFDGLKTDLTSESDALEMKADYDKYLTGKLAAKEAILQINSLQADDDMIDTLKAYLKQLDYALDPKTPVQLSGSAKTILARDRSKMRALVDLHDALKFDPLTDYEQDFGKIFSSLEKRFTNPKYFGKQFVVDGQELWENAKTALELKRTNTFAVQLVKPELEKQTLTIDTWLLSKGLGMDVKAPELYKYRVAAARLYYEKGILTLDEYDTYRSSTSASRVRA